jgi:hypothetical protein
MTEGKNQPDCALAELIAAALSAARAASIALDAVVDVVDHGPLIARVQTILAGQMPPSEDELDEIHVLATVLREATDEHRWWWRPDEAVPPIEELTAAGRQIKLAQARLCAARTAAARAADRSRAEAIIAAHLR